jgi:hypothetical protein
MRRLYADIEDRLWICTTAGVHVVQPGTTRVDTTTLPALGEVTLRSAPLDLRITRATLDAKNLDIEGAVRVAPGSHRFGRLVSAQAVALRAERGEVVPEIPRGGALVMRPLLLHASSKAAAPVARRVLHFVFGPPQLPAGLVWKEAI